MKGYTCAYCNKYWDYDDPGFVYWRTNSQGQNLDGREGRARSGLGWFAYCADKEACAHRKSNKRVGVHPEQISIV